MKMKLLSMIVSLLGLSCCANGQTDSIQTVDAPTFAQIIRTDSAAADSQAVTLVDVRTAEEYAEGHIPDALNIDVLQDDFTQKATARLPKDRRVAVYCRSGKRSLKAAALLVKAGYKVVNLKGGWLEWTANRLPTE
ncbi:MAG: rhodanese-like domain-containing protein [Prevotella sp.]|jgi:rhodanese-related sulfurtransferase|nr:rhodanese-like domain-containing protein [Prevotella sp.]